MLNWLIGATVVAIIIVAVLVLTHKKIEETKKEQKVQFNLVKDLNDQLKRNTDGDRHYKDLLTQSDGCV